MKYFLSLGSNLGDKKGNLRRAVRLLKNAGLKILRASSLFQTQAVGTARRPWFVNQVIEVETALTPWALLVFLQSVEKKMGRTRTVVNGPRPIDLDILLAEETILVTPDLIIPHPRMAGRNFVLVPLSEIAPHVLHPALQKSAAHLLAESRDRSAVQKIGCRSTPGRPAKA